MSRLRTFVPPRPHRGIMQVMTYINHLFIVGGIPFIKHLRPRPLTRITEVSFSDTDQTRLRTLVERKNTAVFITPNHPEFFTDWMLDKYVLARVAPKAASWATHTIVNGMGTLVQRFWLANNLIAQIPRMTETAKRHSIKVAARGDGVLLHPEGAVGWHSNYIGPVFPGAVDMALEVQVLEPEIVTSYVAPVVWKIVFTTDVTDGLLAEYRYICRELKLVPQTGINPAQAVYHLFEELLARDEAVVHLPGNRNDPLGIRIDTYLPAAEVRLGELVYSTERGATLLRAARKWQQNNTDTDRQKLHQVILLIASLERWQKFNAFARDSHVVTQEELADHQKRLRAELCVGGLRNTLNRFVPIAVGPRHAFIRVLEPIEMPPSSEKQTRQQKAAVVEELTQLLRTRLQVGVTELNSGLRGCFISYPNPFIDS